MSKFHMINEKVVKLNVGGTFYSSTKATLTKVADSYLSKLFTGEVACHRDEKGSHFIDRDGPVFRHILNYLRSNRLTVPQGFREFHLLKVEADYYGLPALVQEVELAMNAHRRRRRRKPPHTRKASQSVGELHRVHERNGDLYISDDESDWFYD